MRCSMLNGQKRSCSWPGCHHLRNGDFSDSPRSAVSSFSRGHLLCGPTRLAFAESGSSHDYPRPMPTRLSFQRHCDQRVGGRCHLGVHLPWRPGPHPRLSDIIKGLPGSPSLPSIFREANQVYGSLALYSFQIGRSATPLARRSCSSAEAEFPAGDRFQSDIPSMIVVGLFGILPLVPHGLNRTSTRRESIGGESGKTPSEPEPGNRSGISLRMVPFRSLLPNKGKRACPML
jgi:hypothetical protein